MFRVLLQELKWHVKAICQECSRAPVGLVADLTQLPGRHVRDVLRSLCFFLGPQGVSCMQSRSRHVRELLAKTGEG